MRVPPDQSATVFAMRSRACAGSRPSSSRVTRVSRVPNRKASIRAAVAAREGVEEEEEQARVALHGAADVGEHDDGARLRAAARGGTSRGSRRPAAGCGAACGAGRWRARLRRAGAACAARPASTRDRGSRVRTFSSSSPVSSPKSLWRSSSCALQVRVRWRSGGGSSPRASSPVGSRQRSGRRRGREGGAAELAALAHRAQVERGCALGGLAPEDLEGLVEAGQLVAATHAEGPRRVGEVALRSDRDVVEGGDEIEHPVGARVEAEAAQHAPEREHVAEQLSRHPAARTRSTIACAACPRTFSTSSWYLRRIPRVSPTMSASSARRSSATRAAAQSSVSAIPGSL